MKIKKMLALCCLLPVISSPAAGETYSLKITAINGKISHTYSQKVKANEQSNYVGKAVPLNDKAREIISNILLKPVKSGFSVDYMFEMTGELKERPPFQAMGKIFLAAGERTPAVLAGKWRYYLEVAGKAAGSSAGKNKNLAVTYKCGKTVFNSGFLVQPGSQFNAVLYDEAGKNINKFIFNGLAGENGLQYQLEMKKNGETLGKEAGETGWTSGENKKIAAKSKNCFLWVKSLK